MIKVTLPETTSQNWLMILQILERNKRRMKISEEDSEKGLSDHTAKFDIDDLDSLTDLRTVLKLVSAWSEKGQNQVIIESDNHFINDHSTFAKMLECYSKTFLLGCDDHGSYCCRSYIQKKGSSHYKEYFFKACLQIDERLDCKADPIQYISSIENISIDSQIIFCPDFKKSDWRKKSQDYISSQKDRLDELERTAPPKVDRSDEIAY